MCLHTIRTNKNVSESNFGQKLEICNLLFVPRGLTALAATLGCGAAALEVVCRAGAGTMGFGLAVPPTAALGEDLMAGALTVRVATGEGAAAALMVVSPSAHAGDDAGGLGEVNSGAGAVAAFGDA